MNEQRVLFALALAALASAIVPAAHAAASTLPCSGPSGLLGLLDRPTVGDSTCVVPEGMTVIEAGATAGNVYGGPGGRIDTLPNLELRWGLPDDSEFLWLPPNFQYQSADGGPGAPAPTVRGFGPTTVGVKHELGYTAEWQWIAEALATLPSGDSTFGSHGVGGALNAVVSYGNGPLGVSLMVGVTSQTEPTAAGGQRFQSFNPDLVVTWESTSRLQFYGEMYGQSHSGYRQGWGTDVDGGVQYLVTADLEVDLEEGARVQGNLGGFSNYTGVGLGLMF
ncbi:MAG TPA: transporter [Steroidobacteraceae bacterium]|nr:transporter [Steroidobacteraceae bacterium]